MSTSHSTPYQPPKRQPPRFSILERHIQRFADHHETAPGRVRRWISYMALGGALARLPHRDERPQFLHKGGVSLEMRLKLRARATQDFDTTFRGTRDELLDALDAATSSLRDACEKTFAFRGTTVWPPALDVPEHWPPLYARLAEDNAVTPSEAAEAAILVNACIAQIVDA